jgi:hypothetical protein
LLALVAASLAITATASAGANHTTVTETDRVEALVVCTGNPMTFFFDGNLVAHDTLFFDAGNTSGIPDNVWATFTETGKFTGSDTVNGQIVDYSGHVTAWGNFNLNERNTNDSFTVTGTATGSDGTSFFFHDTFHEESEASAYLKRRARRCETGSAEAGRGKAVRFETSAPNYCDRFGGLISAVHDRMRSEVVASSQSS